ncbi:MAG: hypothetical protein JRD03_12120 [Deltaproteobacteria bacterium]|nr:hypothetical protein [Deltaproteobacteria bacterium]
MPAHMMAAEPTELWATPNPRTITLLDLVSNLLESSEDDREVVETVMNLVHRGRVRLIGQVVEVDLVDH